MQENDRRLTDAETACVYRWVDMKGKDIENRGQGCATNRLDAAWVNDLQQTGSKI